MLRTGLSDAAVPVPSVKPVCRKVYEKNDPVTGTLYQSTGVWNDQEVSDNRSQWWVTLSTPGPV